MKISELLISALLMVVFSISASAQHNHSGMGSNSNMNTNMNTNMNMNTQTNMIPDKTASLKVWGKCEMCKARIERIAIANGALSADWNIKTKMLTTTFNPLRTDMEYISGKLAKNGHDTGFNSAKDKAYNLLPECCKYERNR